MTEAEAKIAADHPQLKLAYDRMAEKQDALDAYQDACEGGMLEYLFLKAAAQSAKETFEEMLGDILNDDEDEFWLEAFGIVFGEDGKMVLPAS